MYVKRFYEKALDCSDLVTDEVLVDVSLHCMMEEYQIFL